MRYFDNIVQNKKLILFGAGSLIAQVLKVYLKSHDVAYICDNDQSKWNSTFMEIPVYPPEKLLEEDYDKIIVLITSMYRYEILQQLLDLKIPSVTLDIFNYHANSSNNSDSRIFVDSVSMPISYPDISGKKILLVGNEKYMDDVIDYFSELTIHKCEKIVPEFENNETLYVICHFKDDQNLSQTQENLLNKIYEYKLPHIWIKDLIDTLHEPETYYTTVYQPNKRIVVLGDRRLTQQLIRNNPNMQLYSVIEISDWDRDICMFLQERLYPFPVKPLFLLVTNEYIIAKDAMVKAGYTFGCDFYFHDSNNIKLAQMLEETIRCKTYEDFGCTITTMLCGIMSDGSVRNCCCRIDEPCGNILHNTLENIISSPMSRILHLSTVNKTYCFCCEYCKYSQRSTFADNVAVPRRNGFVLPHISDYKISPGYLEACNLNCRFCRNEKILDDSEPLKLSIHNEFLSTIGKIKGIENSMGELLFSKLGRELLEADPSNIIKFNTNGMLLNHDNWKYLQNFYNEISVTFSIDGGTKKTFEYLRRGANYDTVINNLRIAGDLRANGKIKELKIQCVVQRDNFRELDEIVKIGREVNADGILFVRIRYADTYSDEEFFQVDVQNPKNPFHVEFLNLIVANPIFQESDIWFYGLKHLLSSYKAMWKDDENTGKIE